MKRIFLFFSILLCSIVMSAQSAWIFNRGDSISWQPSQDMTITYEKDPAGFFWQNIQTNTLDVVRMPIETGDGIIFADTPFLQVEKNCFELTNDGERRLEVRLKTNITDWTSINCQPQADWIRLIETKSDQFSIVTYMFEYDVNYTGADREAQIVFKNEQYGLSDIVKVTSIGETETNYISVDKLEYHVINQSDNSIDIKYRANSEAVFDIIDDSYNWIHETYHSFDEGQGHQGLVRYSYDNNFTGKKRIARIAVHDQSGNVRDTISVIHHPAKLAYLSGWYNRFLVCQPTGGIVEIPFWGEDSLEVVMYDPTDEWSTSPSGNPLPDYMNRLTDEIRDGNRIIRLQIEPNTSDEERYYVLCVKVGDASADRFRFLQPWKGAPSFDEQVEALKEFYISNNGNEWQNNKNWMSDKPVNEWYGVNNHNYGDTIVGNYILTLNLNDNSIHGKIPKCLSKLLPYSKKYGEINLRMNFLHGKIPNSVKEHPRWNDVGWNIISQYERKPNKTLFDYDDFGLTTSDSAVINIVNDEKLMVHETLKQNKITLVYNAGLVRADWFSGISDGLVNLYLDYCNKGFGLVARVGDYNDYSYDYCKEYINDRIEQGMPTGIKWATPSFGDHDANWVNSLALYDSDGNLVQFYGVVSDEEVVPTWYVEQIDSVLRARLGAPDNHELYVSKDYVSTDYSRDGEVVVLQKATVGKGVNLVFLGDAFIDKHMGKDGEYESRMREAMEQFFSEEPYTSLRNRFNVYTVKAISKKIANHDGSSGDAGHAINQSTQKAFEYASKAVGEDAEYIMVNVIYNEGAALDRDYTEMFMEDGSYVSYIFGGAGSGRLINHEGGGHGVAFLADEYVEGGNEEAGFDEGGKRILDEWWTSYGYGANVDYHSNPSEVKWAHFINDARYADEKIGVYEGAHLAGKGCYRPTENSMMRYNDSGFNAPSREAIYKRVMKLSEGDSWTYDFEKFVEFDTPAREAYIQQRNARQRAKAQKVQDRRIESRPPTIYKGTWRDTGDKQKVVYQKYLEK